MAHILRRLAQVISVILALVAAVVLIGSMAGLAFAQTGSDSSGKTLLGRVATILGIDQQKGESAFTQARGERHTEAPDRYLQNLIDKGKITKEQAAQYKKWWQSRPDTTQYEQQLREWQETRPDVPLAGGFGGRGFRGGMMWGGGRCF